MFGGVSLGVREDASANKGPNVLLVEDGDNQGLTVETAAAPATETTLSDEIGQLKVGVALCFRQRLCQFPWCFVCCRYRWRCSRTRCQTA